MSTTDRPRPPSIERVLAAARARTGERDADAVLTVARDVVAAERARLAEGQAPQDAAALAATVVATLEAFDGPASEDLGPATDPGRAATSGPAGPTTAINATGVFVHTNLGRSVLSPAAAHRGGEASSRYLDLIKSLGLSNGPAAP